MTTLRHKIKHLWIAIRIGGILGAWPSVTRKEAEALGWELPRCEIDGYGDQFQA